MTKAQMAARIAELEKEVEALKAGASVETHIHYHYPQTLPQQTYYWPPNWWQQPYYVGTGSGDSLPVTWNYDAGSTPL